MRAAGDASVARAMPGARAWTPAPPSELTSRLLAAKAEIEASKPIEGLASESGLGQLLPDRPGGLAAATPLSSTTRGDGTTRATVVARNYKQGKQQIRIKITDTAEVPGARAAVSEHLTDVGNAATGNERGAFIGAFPATVSALERQRVSQAQALVGNRFLVQVMVREASSPDAALDVLRALDLPKLAAVKGASKPAKAPSKATKR